MVVSLFLSLLSLLLYITVLTYIYICLVYALFTSNGICYLRREALLNDRGVLNHGVPAACEQGNEPYNSMKGASF